MAAKSRFNRSFVYDPALELWKGRRRVRWWGLRRLEVWVLAGAEGPSQRQLDCLDAITAYRGNLIREFEARVYAYYTDNYEGFEGVPKLTSSSRVWESLGLATLVVLPSTQDAVEFLLIMECTWDREHGLGVRWKNWSIVDIGGQSDVSYEDSC